MIISHKHKFIFFAIPKTGTHSIRFALRPYLADEDEEHVSLFHNARLNIDDFKDRANGHMSVQEIRPHITDEIWNSYFKFCFVRNPWDRFVSTVFFKNEHVQQEDKYAYPLMKYTIDKETDNTSLFYRPQTAYLIDEANNLAMDFIGRTENMQADYETICKHLNIPCQQLERKNTSQHHHYHNYYDNELQQKVGSLYRQDIENFGYSF